MSDLILGQHPLLKKQFVDRRIRDLTEKSFVADLLLSKTSIDALSIKYFKDGDADANGLYAYEEVPEVGEGSGYKRIGLKEEAKLAMIRKYGLEFAFSYEQQKWGQNSFYERGYKKLSNSTVAMVNDMAYSRIEGAAGILGRTKAGGAGDAYWGDTTNGAEQMIKDIVTAKAEAKKAGYDLDTMVISPQVEILFLTNKNIRDAFRVNNTDQILLSGHIGNFLGLDVIVDRNYKDNQVLFVQRGMIGDIADAEGLKSKVYNQDEDDTTIVRVTRFCEAYITDPKGIYLLKNVASA